MTDREHARTTAHRVLEVDEAQPMRETRLEDDLATVFAHPVRGGGAVIVADDGSALRIPSATGPADALREFRAGVRTHPASTS